MPLARIESVEPLSPADDAGFYKGCCIKAVNGHGLRDIIDWRWYSCDERIELSYIDGQGDEGSVVLERDEGEDWGFTFNDVVFDEVIQCRNACIFCFMRQLPDKARDSLSLRDDDYRLSFLQGNFVTFTNIGPEDEARIIEQHISPLRYSLHCVSPDLRAKVIGRHAQHGLDVAARLLEAGIELHAQIVLMPGVNDGEELKRTLQWCYEQGMANVGIVPLGFTKHQNRFSESFNDPKAAAAVLECIEPFQQRALRERGDAWVYAADEFYSNAYPETLLEELPAAAFYGDFELFEDGIGILRSFVDDWTDSPRLIRSCAAALKRADACVLLAYGEAMREAFDALLGKSELAGRLVPVYVRNGYFGGNVDVSGLLCGCDIAPALQLAKRRLEAEGKSVAFAALPKVMFNADALSLDDMTVQQIELDSGLPVHVVSCVASEYLQQIQQLLAN